MATYNVSVTRSYETDVAVEADTPEAAAEKVNDAAFPLPPIEQWQGMKDWRIDVRNDETYDLLHTMER